MVRTINSKQNNKIKEAASLKENKNRKKTNLFLSEGYKNLEMALKNNAVKEIFTLKEIEGIDANIDQYIISEEILNKLTTSKNPEGVCFVCEKLDLKPEKLKKIIYLDILQDPGNVGTIIRTALAFDYDLICMSKNCVDIYNDKVIAASKGAIFEMPIETDCDIEKFKNNYPIIVSTLDDKSKNLDEIKQLDKFVLVIGNEAHGVSQEIIEIASEKVKISIKNIDSLNAAIAAGILMYHFK